MGVAVKLVALRPSVVYTSDITHNLAGMAREAGLYHAIWGGQQPAGCITMVSSIEPVLVQGLELLKAEPERFKAMNPPNTWGTYEGFVTFVEALLIACRENPDAEVVRYA